MKSRLSQSIAVFTLGVLSFPTLVFGRDLNSADDLLGEVGDRGGVADVSIENAVGSAIGIVLSLVGVIFLILMVYAGVLWLTARGEQSQVDKSRKIIVSTVIGLVITVSAYAITALVVGRLGG